MKEKSKIYLFIQVIIGVVVAHFILTRLASFMGWNEPPVKIPKNQMAQVEATELLHGLLHGLRGYHMENRVFPQSYEAIRGEHSYALIYHQIEVSPIDNNTVVFRILPQISDLYAFSGMIVYNTTTRGYQEIICQSEEYSKSISFPEVISQCPPIDGMRVSITRN